MEQIFTGMNGFVALAVAFAAVVAIAASVIVSGALLATAAEKIIKWKRDR
jgi:hypothetical protein